MQNPATTPTVAEAAKASTEVTEAKADTVHSLSEWLKDDLQAVNRTILDNMQSPVSLIPQLAGHLIESGGKRIRPLLTLLAVRAVGYGGTAHINLAASVEFIHSATLLHDDVIDESQLRRGVDSANSLWGNQASVLVGDFLFSRAFQMMVRSGSAEVQKLLADTAATIAEGEVNQLRLKGAPNSDEQLYLQVIFGKTAALFAAACAIAGKLCENERQTHYYEALYGYGRDLGMAFQLVDDILDYSANQEKLGKSVGDDFAEGKVTLPVIFAWQNATAEERAFLNRTMKHTEQHDGDFAAMQELLQKYGCLQKTLSYAEAYGNKALQALSVFEDSSSPPDNKNNTDTPTALEYMRDLVGFCLRRGY